MRVRKHLISIQIVSKLAQKMMPLGKCLPSPNPSVGRARFFQFASHFLIFYSFHASFLFLRLRVCKFTLLRENSSKLQLHMEKYVIVSISTRYRLIFNPADAKIPQHNKSEH